MTLWVIIIIIAVWFIVKNYSGKNAPGPDGHKSNSISEDTVLKVQTQFEKNLEDTYLPDAVTGRDLYIYNYLMRSWYNELVAKNRYNEVMIQKLRNDWLDYIEALGDRQTYNFLSLEAQDKGGEEIYREKHIIASRKVFAIEDGFASEVGQGQLEKLQKIRELGFFDFSREGEIAPEGQEFDVSGNLRKKRN